MLVEQHTDRVVVRAPAKINLFLEVLGKRADGYHDIVTLMAAINLFDTLECKEDPSREIHLTCDDAAIPTGPANLAWRAAELLRRETRIERGVSLTLAKRIPTAAGLAGGSSDAAATLLGLNRLWNLNLSRHELARLAAMLGSDIPFFLSLPAAWCTGRGEIVTPSTLREPLHLVLACPSVGLATAEVYRHVRVPEQPRSADAIRQAVEGGRVEAIGAELFNRLQLTAEPLCPEVAALRELFTRLAPVGHAMSGSGTSYFALCRTPEDAESLAQVVRTQWPGGQSLRVFVVRSLVAGEW